MELGTGRYSVLRDSRVSSMNTVRKHEPMLRFVACTVVRSESCFPAAIEEELLLEALALCFDGGPDIVFR